MSINHNLIVEQLKLDRFLSPNYNLLCEANQDIEMGVGRSSNIESADWGLPHLQNPLKALAYYKDFHNDFSKKIVAYI